MKMAVITVDGQWTMETVIMATLVITRIRVTNQVLVKTFATEGIAIPEECTMTNQQVTSRDQRSAVQT